MPASSYNISLVQGDTLDIVFTWKTPNGDLVNLTGYEAELLAQTPSGEVVAHLTVGDGVTMGGEDGTIEVFMSAADTALLPQREAVYSLWATSSGGQVTTLEQGSFDVIGR